MNALTTVLCIYLPIIIPVLNLSMLAGGQPSSKIFDGDVAEIGQFPYVVSIRNKICGGAIISPKHILTEAWCIGTQWYMNIKAGCNDFQSPNCTDYKVENVTIHPNYTGTGIYDVAIITIEGEFVMSELIQSIPVNPDFVPGGANVTVVGWTPELRWRKLRVTPSDICDLWWHWREPEMLMCTVPGNVTGNSADYGCPVILDGQLVGITVLSETYSGLHQRVGDFVEWINSVIEVGE